MLVQGQVEAPRPKTVPRELERQQAAEPRRPVVLAALALPVGPNRRECSGMFLGLQRRRRSACCLSYTCVHVQKTKLIC